MKMKDSMDRMEFDQGNLQEEAPRRVQRRKRPELKPIWFAAVAVVLLAVVLVGFAALGGYFFYAVTAYGTRWFSTPYNTRLQLSLIHI